MIKVLIISRSAVMRRVLATIFPPEPGVKIVASVTDSQAAQEEINSIQPDVLIVDLEPPYLGNMQILETLIEKYAIPIVVIAPMSDEGMDAVILALELGVVDFIDKPTLDMQRGYQNIVNTITAKLMCAAEANISNLDTLTDTSSELVKLEDAKPSGECVIGIGASTGGVRALRTVFSGLPADSPAILVTQNMPIGLTKKLANRLNATSNMAICEALHDQVIMPGHVYIAPGDHHLRIARDASGYVCDLSLDPPVMGARPSIDVLFHSIARVVGSQAIGVILSGVGDDGVSGLLAMRDLGAMTIGQDEFSSMVYEKPKNAARKGGCVMEKNIADIASTIIENCGTKLL